MSNWIKTKDKLPEESGEYIVYWLGDIEVIWFEPEIGWLNHFEVPIQEQKEVTHWQPLPEKPINEPKQ